VSARITRAYASTRPVLSRRTGSGQTRNAQTCSRGANVTEQPLTEWEIRARRAIHIIDQQLGNGTWDLNAVSHTLTNERQA